MTNFVRKIFHPDLFDPDKIAKPTEEQITNTQAQLVEQLTTFLVEVIQDLGNPRLLKSLLREWKLNYTRHLDAGHEPDYRVELAIQASKYLGNPGLKFENMHTGAKLSYDTLLGTYLGAVYAARTQIRDVNNSFSRHTNLTEFRFVDSPDYDLPKSLTTNNINGYEHYFGISSWYLM
jgi:hypothetical protein